MNLSDFSTLTFDCYGTLIDFQARALSRERLGDRIAGERMDAFIIDFARYRYDEVLGAWQPYADVLRRALERTCARHGVAFHGAAYLGAHRRLDVENLLAGAGLGHDVGLWNDETIAGA